VDNAEPSENTDSGAWEFVHPLPEETRAASAMSAPPRDEEIDVTQVPEDGDEPIPAPDLSNIGFLSLRQFLIRLQDPPKLGFTFGYRKKLHIYDDVAKYSDKKAERIAVVDEEASVLILYLRSLKLGPVPLRSFLPTRLVVREQPEGPVVFSLRWRVSLVRFYLRIDICNGNGELLGYLRKKIFSLYGGFWIYDAQDREVAEVKAKTTPLPRAALLSPEDRELGNVTLGGLLESRKAGKMGVSHAGWNVTEKIGVTATVADEESENPLVKILLLASALAIEFTGVAKHFVGKNS
jgi:hypothetical protein